MKKRILAALLAATMVFGGLAGCAGQASSAVSSAAASTASESSTPEEQKTPAADKFIIFQRKGELNAIFEELAEVYKAETGVTMEVWGDMGDGYINTLQGKLTSGYGPTIFTVRAGVETELLKEYLSDLSSEPYIDKILNDLELRADGKVVGIPYGLEGYGFLCNPNLVDPASIKDVASFEKAMKDAAAKDVVPFELSDKGFMLIAHILNVPFAMQADPLAFIEKLNKGEVKMADTPEFQEWAKYYAAIRDNNPNPMEISYDKQIGDFATGKAAMIHQGNWTNVMFDDYEVDFDITMIPMPVNGNKKISVGVPNFFAINTQSDPAEAQAAKDFLVWLYTSDTGKKFMVENLKLIPTVEGIEAPNLDAMSQAVFDSTQKGETLMWTYNYWPNNIVNNFLAQVGQEFFLDKTMSEKDLLAKLDEAWAEANKAV